MRVSFDSNVWEKIFDPFDTLSASIRAALASRAIEGFICEAGFRIEAITKGDRATYFAQPYMDRRFDGRVMRDGRPHVQVSFGPDDTRHPGLPSVQADKLGRALSTGVLLMRGSPWMGLPAPPEIWDPQIFVSETREGAHDREQRQIDAMALIEARGVGKAAFDAVGGWSLSAMPPSDEKRSARHVRNGRTVSWWALTLPISTRSCAPMIARGLPELQSSILQIGHGSPTNSA
jgi:hypothetical protein